MRLKTPIILFLTLALLLATLPTAHGQSQSTQELALEGPTWDHSLITILITPPLNESWWNPLYLNATLQAIGEWNDAIAYFASNYSDFAYLSELRMEPYLSNQSNQDFDVSISWIHEFGNETCDAGLTTTSYQSGVVFESSTKISALDCFGDVLNEADSQNVAVHELGHVLGLGHSNYTRDLMYYSLALGSPVRSISTLDLYGVAIVFRWMTSSPEYDPDNQGVPIYSVTLPTIIMYENLPVSENNLPPLSPFERLAKVFAGFPQAVSTPEFWGVMVSFTVAVIAFYVVARRGARKRKSLR